MRIEAATISDILYLFGQGNCVFIREKSGNFEKLMSVAAMFLPRKVSYRAERHEIMKSCEMMKYSVGQVDRSGMRSSLSSLKSL